MPRFRELRAEDIERKKTADDPNDVVTVIDLLVEKRLTAELPALAGGAPVVGEEGVYARPELLDLLRSDDPLWLLDPIDGTKNLASGSEDFGVMLAWIVGGLARASWIVLPMTGRMFVAERGAGAFVNGERVETPPIVADRPGGTLHVGYLKRPVATSVLASLEGRYTPLDDAGCSAVEYTQVLLGERDFSVYHRLNAWDHAPGALIVSEGGGRVEHVDGATYTPRSGNQLTVVAGSPEVSSRVRGWLEPHEAEARR